MNNAFRGLLVNGLRQMDREVLIETSLKAADELDDFDESIPIALAIRELCRRLENSASPK